MKLLLYCTKSKPYLNDCKLINNNKRYFISNKGLWSIDLSTQQTYSVLNGKIVAECDYEVEEIKPFFCENIKKFEKESCLTMRECAEYLKDFYGYAIRIKNLNIFNEPKKLTDCYRIIPPDEIGCRYKSIRKAPQNMMYAYDYFGDDDNKVLISIHPEHLCKILNGEKTIEVRKKVLKEMLNDK